MNVIMIVLTVWLGMSSPAMTQSSIETTVATCQQARELAGQHEIELPPTSGGDKRGLLIFRKVDCIPIK